MTNFFTEVVFKNFGTFLGIFLLLCVVVVGVVAITDTVMNGIAKMIHGEAKTINHYINTKELDKKIEEEKKLKK